MHDHLAVEHGARGASQYALIELAALAVRFGVVDTGVMVDMLPAARHVQPVKRAFGALGLEPYLYVDHPPRTHHTKPPGKRPRSFKGILPGPPRAAFGPKTVLKHSPTPNN